MGQTWLISNFLLPSFFFILFLRTAGICHCLLELSLKAPPSGQSNSWCKYREKREDQNGVPREPLHPPHPPISAWGDFLPLLSLSWPLGTEPATLLNGNWIGDSKLKLTSSSKEYKAMINGFLMLHCFTLGALFFNGVCRRGRIKSVHMWEHSFVYTYLSHFLSNFHH